MRIPSSLNLKVGVLLGNQKDKLQGSERFAQFLRFWGGKSVKNSSLFLIQSHDSASGTIQLGNKGQLVVEFPKMDNEIGFHLGNKAHELISNELRGSCLPSLTVVPTMAALGKSRKGYKKKRIYVLGFVCDFLWRMSKKKLKKKH